MLAGQLCWSPLQREGPCLGRRSLRHVLDKGNARLDMLATPHARDASDLGGQG